MCGNLLVDLRGYKKILNQYYLWGPKIIEKIS